MVLTHEIRANIATLIVKQYKNTHRDNLFILRGCSNVKMTVKLPVSLNVNVRLLRTEKCFLTWYCQSLQTTYDPLPLFTFQLLFFIDISTKIRSKCKNSTGRYKIIQVWPSNQRKAAAPTEINGHIFKFKIGAQSRAHSHWTVSCKTDRLTNHAQSKTAKQPITIAIVCAS